jgi:hypothetical protein
MFAEREHILRDERTAGRPHQYAGAPRHEWCRHVQVSVTSMVTSGLTGCKIETVGLCFHLQLSVSVYANVLSRRCQFTQIC